MISEPFYSLTNLQGGNYEIIIDLNDEGSCFFFYEGSLNEIVISLIEIEDECRDFKNGSIFVEIEGIECGGYYAGWTSGDTGNKADNLSAGEYCIQVACANNTDCKVEECFTVGNAPTGCDEDLSCEKLISKEVLVDPSGIFFNTALNACSSGVIFFEAFNSSVYPINITYLPGSGGDNGCLTGFPFIQLDESNPIDYFEILCESNNQNCAGEYCFEIERNGCPPVKICRYLNYCFGDPSNPKYIGCRGGDGIGGEVAIAKAELFSNNDNEEGVEKNENARTNKVNLDDLSFETKIPEAANFQYKVYPNPFKSFINIEVQSLKEQTLNISLKDIYGRTILNQKLETLEGRNETQLNAPTNLPDGIYLLIFSDESGTTFSEFVTKINL